LEEERSNGTVTSKMEQTRFLSCAERRREGNDKKKERKEKKKDL
jgi:hypothetical protein